MDEHVLTAVFTLDETEALARVEELYDALAGADDLRGHTATGATAAAAETTAAAAARAATEAAAVTTATKATTVTAAIAAAVTTAIITESAAIAVVTTATAATVVWALIESEPALRERIVIVFAETIAFVAATTAPTSVITHKSKRTLTLALPSIAMACGRTETDDFGPIPRATVPDGETL
ncbi:hypothetical protein GCM10010989_04030 [Croceicoccus pelagius]|uniref:Uncharacterized protein n=1 Tax=Croceicoccus pelagius TaxID=1703341 RepID=A0A916Y7I0_9SPHN|nr:hypothetical protein GCM10010989_04030 [Croceicoccus pelagius]